jgi:hypothetical protein
MTPSSSTPWRRVWLLFAILAAQVLAGVFVAGLILLACHSPLWKTVSCDEALQRLSLGVAFSHVTLLASWNALGDAKWLVRPTSSALCLIGVWIALCGINAIFQSFLSLYLSLVVAMFGQWVLVQIPFWIARLTFGWQIGTVDQCHAANGVRGAQFGIKHLLIWTAVVAILLALSKWVVVGETTRFRRELGELGLFILCNSLFAWPILVGCLVNRWMPAALLTLLVTFAEPHLFKAVTTVTPRQHIFAWLNGIQFIWTVGSLSVLRWFGFRFVRDRGHSESARP